MLDINDRTKDVYQTWFSYLIRTEIFRPSIDFMQSGQSLPDGPLADFSKGYHHWTCHLLPDLWNHNPTDESFESIWSAWTRRQTRERGAAVREFPWDQLRTSVSHSIISGVDSFNDETGRMPAQPELSQIITEETDKIINLFMDGNRFALWIDPTGDQYDKIEGDITKRVSVLRENMAKAGVNFSNSSECRYNSPTTSPRDNLFKKDGKTLRRLKRQLNVLALRQSGLAVNSIASGCFSTKGLPFSLDVFSLSIHGSAILEQQSIRKGSGDFTLELPPAETPKEVKDGIYEDLKEARKTLSAVEEGWFPTCPT